MKPEERVAIRMTCIQEAIKIIGTMTPTPEHIINNADKFYEWVTETSVDELLKQNKK